MAFVNEKISDKDIEKYNLFQFNKKYEKEKKKDIMSFHNPYDWVIDKEKEIFLIYFSSFIDEIDDHAIYFKKEELFIFYYEKKFYEILLKRERAITPTLRREIALDLILSIKLLYES